MKNYWLHPWPVGDIRPEEYRYAYRTYAMEKKLRQTWEGMQSHLRARCLFALAYDMLDANMEEVSENYIEEALTLCPNYLVMYLKNDMKNSAEFALISLKLSLTFPNIFGNIIEGE